MAKVELVSETQMAPEQIASNAARTCYESEMPALEKEKINVRERLFKTGHHTTLEHTNFNFAIDDISVSTITYGLHLAHPFYNSDQRSGRYSKMYDNPDTKEIEERLKTYYPDSAADVRWAMGLINLGWIVFAENKDKLTGIASDVLRRERPHVSEKYIEQNAKKMAQEQLRVFMSTVMPTGMYHTIDLVTLAALNRVAWIPEMIDVVNKMVEIVRCNHPEIEYIFDNNILQTTNFCDLDAGSKEQRSTLFSNKVKSGNRGGVRFAPKLEIKNIDIPRDYIPGNPNKLRGFSDSVDLLHFSPRSMDNNVYSIRTEVELSTMTMGQDQRHRTIARSAPHITGNFYLPPLLKIAGLENNAKELQREWVHFMKDRPDLANFIAPYGAMVRYQKRSGLNALLHEQEKRLCWCAQEEIYNLNVQLARQLYDRKFIILADKLRPWCSHGKCLEGARYCGRDMPVWEKGALAGFIQRQI